VCLKIASALPPTSGGAVIPTEGIEGERFRTSQVQKVGGYIAELGYTPSFLTPPCLDFEI